MNASISQTKTLKAHLLGLSDPRTRRKPLHLLIDILMIAICATIAGADSWTQIEEFGKAKEPWLKTFLALPNGIPSHDTFGRVFASLNSDEFARIFVQWTKSVTTLSMFTTVAIDGKTSRRSHDRAKGLKPIHMVSAWASELGLVLGQVKTEEKSNEITAIPELLQLLEIEGCIVTIDAMGCQKRIAGDIREQNAHYMLQVKMNQPTMLQDIERVFERVDSGEIPIIDSRERGSQTLANLQESCDEEDGFRFCMTESTHNQGHGREETRQIWTTNALGQLSQGKAWHDLQSISRVRRQRTVKGKTSTEDSYYLSSLTADMVEHHSRSVRQHWGVENGLHWRLDVIFREDENRFRAGNGAENMSRLRHLAVNLLQQERSGKRTMPMKRMRAAWDESYLAKIILGASGIISA